MKKYFAIILIVSFVCNVSVYAQRRVCIDRNWQFYSNTTTIADININDSN